MLKIYSMLFIENQMVNNKAITKLFQNYQLDITINKIFIGNALRYRCASPKRQTTKTRKFTT
jgi:hypothetical protein